MNVVRKRISQIILSIISMHVQVKVLCHGNGVKPYIVIEEVCQDVHDKHKNHLFLLYKAFSATSRECIIALLYWSWFTLRGNC